MSGERLVTQIHLILFRLPGTEGRVFEKKEEEHTKKDCMIGFIHSTLFLNFFIFEVFPKEFFHLNDYIVSVIGITAGSNFHFRLLK